MGRGTMSVAVNHQFPTSITNKPISREKGIAGSGKKIELLHPLVSLFYQLILPKSNQKTF